MKTDKGVLTTPDAVTSSFVGVSGERQIPHLADDERKRHFADLMTARRALKEAISDEERTRSAHHAVDAAKVVLGERGPR